MILKNFQFQKTKQGWNVKKVSKQIRDERNMETNKRFKCYWRMKINPKACAIPILTSLVNAVRIGIANALGFIFVH